MIKTDGTPTIAWDPRVGDILDAPNAPDIGVEAEDHVQDDDLIGVV